MSWFQRLKQGLTRSTEKVKTQFTEVIGKAKLEAEDLEKIEEALILADMGPQSAADISAEMAKRRFEKGITEDSLMDALAEEIALLLQPVAEPLQMHAKGVNTVLVVGVNGGGKTTTIAKLARQYVDQNKKVVLAAGDTFRAAAVEQLKIWGARIGVDVVTAPHGGDVAGLVFDAMSRAEDVRADILLIDTAGRLHNKHNLMQELSKIVRVMKKKIQRRHIMFCWCWTVARGKM
ncbi:MAG: signal recognition particle receptor subunit alpha, partial [Alphaproteobacteria bacterium]|nr:signal recognition particle receptor subunit alpha [Alphaproteobacteria bacterium]